MKLTDKKDRLSKFYDMVSKELDYRNIDNYDDMKLLIDTFIEYIEIEGKSIKFVLIDGYYYRDASKYLREVDSG